MSNGHNEQVRQYAADRLGQQVGDGECFTLADQALRNAGARSAADYGEITDDADYVWGEEVAQGAAQAGDIIQFRNYRVEITTVRHVVYPDGSEETETQTAVQSRPHHTAVVSTTGQDGEHSVYEQNVGEGSDARAVQRNRLYFSSRQEPAETSTEGGAAVTVTRTIDVSGQVWFYRPQAQQ